MNIAIHRPNYEKQFPCQLGRGNVVGGVNEIERRLREPNLGQDWIHWIRSGNS